MAVTSEYQQAQRLAGRETNLADFSGGSALLPALDDIISKNDLAGELDLGVCEIPLSEVVGTKTGGRQTSFASNFMPLLPENSEFADKWKAVYEAQVNEGLRDPIKVYEYLNRFYVEEGNKRVSVLKYLNAYSYRARVYRLLPKKSDKLRIRIYYEYLDFYKVTGFFTVVYSKTGSYARLASLLGQNLTDRWPEELLKDLETAHFVFSDIFLSRGGRKLGITVHDAMLIYLSVYPLNTLTSGSRPDITERIDRVWKEFIVETRPESIALVDDPEKIGSRSKPQGGFFRLFSGSPYTKERPLSAAFIYAKNPNNSTWVYNHELGRLDVENRFGGLVKTRAISDCNTDEAVRKAIDVALFEKCDVIFTTSPFMMRQTVAAAVENPKAIFLNCSINLSAKSVRTYYEQLYGVKFLMGALAGSLADNHLIGYEAEYPLLGSIANINAFALGAALVDPKSRVILKWNKLKGHTAADVDFDPEVRIVCGHDFIRPNRADKRGGLYRIEDDGSISNLALPMVNWGRYYRLIIESVLNGSYSQATLGQKDEALNYWYGLSSGVVDLLTASRISYHSLKMLNAVRMSITANFMHPFGGEMRDQGGNVIKPAGSPGLTNEEILTMNYLVDNVTGEIPPAEEFQMDSFGLLSLLKISEEAALTAKETVTAKAQLAQAEKPVPPDIEAKAAKAAQIKANERAELAESKAAAAEQKLKEAAIAKEEAEETLARARQAQEAALDAAAEVAKAKAEVDEKAARVKEAVSAVEDTVGEVIQGSGITEKAPALNDAANKASENAAAVEKKQETIRKKAEALAAVAASLDPKDDGEVAE